MAAPQKKAARVNSSRGTNDRNPDKGEVGGLSPARPTMNQKQYLCGDFHFHLYLKFPTKLVVNHLSISNRLKWRP